MPLFVVDTIQTYRIRYVIECMSAEHAADTVVMKEASEFSQMDLGETILTSKEISYKKFLKMNKALEEGYGDGNHYQPESGSPWMGDKMIHTFNYGRDV